MLNSQTKSSLRQKQDGCRRSLFSRQKHWFFMISLREVLLMTLRYVIKYGQITQHSTVKGANHA